MKDVSGRTVGAFGQFDEAVAEEVAGSDLCAGIFPKIPFVGFDDLERDEDVIESAGLLRFYLGDFTDIKAHQLYLLPDFDSSRVADKREVRQLPLAPSLALRALV